MGKKQFFFLCDTETTIKNTVADFSGVIVDRKGKIYNQIAVLIKGHYGKHKLFYDKNSADEIWTLKGLERRENAYKDMLNNGQRMLASVAAVNRWLEQAHKTYPGLIFSAYNSSFDLDKMRKTGINTEGFEGREFCLWRASVDRIKGNRRFVQHCIQNDWLTAKFNLRTNAECVAEYVMGHELPPEPHTAMEDILDYELPILVWLLKKQSWKKYGQAGYNYRNWRLKDLVIPK